MMMIVNDKHISTPAKLASPTIRGRFCCFRSCPGTGEVGSLDVVVLTRIISQGEDDNYTKL